MSSFLCVGGNDDDVGPSEFADLLVDVGERDLAIVLFSDGLILGRVCLVHLVKCLPGDSGVRVHEDEAVLLHAQGLHRVMDQRPLEVWSATKSEKRKGLKTVKHFALLDFHISLINSFRLKN